MWIQVVEAPDAEEVARDSRPQVHTVLVHEVESVEADDGVAAAGLGGDREIEVVEVSGHEAHCLLEELPSVSMFALTLTSASSKIKSLLIAQTLSSRLLKSNMLNNYIKYHELNYF